MVARVTRLVAEKFVLSTFPRALTTLSSMCSRAVRALESSPGLIMMMDNLPAVGNRVPRTGGDEPTGLCLLFIHPRAPNLIGLRSVGTMPA